MNISPVIIVKDASGTIAQTLESLKKFDEVIVYDTGSVDNTMEIARQYPNVKLCKGNFCGFGKTKNKAALMARNDWIFSIDADEVVSPELMKAIQDLVADESCVYRIKRYNYYRKRRIRFSGWGKEFIIRIYNKTRFQFNDKLVHEYIDAENAGIITLAGELRHFSYSSISEIIRKRNLYSELFASENMGKLKSSPFTALWHATFDFFSTFILKAAIFDGYRGLLIAVSNAHVTFIKYIKLYEANLGNDTRVSLIIWLNENHPNSVKNLLESALNQTIAPDEIIISANQLSAEAMEIITIITSKAFIPIRLSYPTHAENRFEPCNQAIGKATFDYLIFIEGKGILDKNFVHDHVKHARKGYFLQGSNIFANEKDFINKKQQINGKFSKLRNWILLKGLFPAFPCGKSDSKNKQFNFFNISFFKDQLFETLETRAGIIDIDKVKADLIKRITKSGLKRKKLRLSGIHYHFNDRFPPKIQPKKKVLVCLDRLKNPNCGLGQVSINMGRKIISEGKQEFEFSFLLPGKGFPEFENEIKSIRLKPLRYLLDDYMKKYDVCHVIHQLPSYKFGAARKNILTIHDLNFLYTKTNHKKKKYLRKLQRNINKSDAITFISEFTRQICFENLHIPPDKITRVIYNGVTPPGMDFEKPDWLPSSRFLFSIGQFLEKKNFHVLLPFVNLLPEDIILVIAGENNTGYGQKIKQIISLNSLTDRVILPGAISEMYKNYLYHHCEAFLFPSIAEGFGLPVIEAMLCSKPVFCSNRTSLKEIGGEFAFFWNDFEAVNMLRVFTEGLGKFKDEEFIRKQLDYANSFTHEKNITEYIKIYKDMING
jgi:glycosyltransferase involved in cell wall biosynthesis